MRMNLDLALRTGFTQAGLVILLALLLMLALPDDFFSDWGWLSGPVAWLACALVVALRYKLPRFLTLIGAAAAGVPMLLALAIGAHWAGVLVGIVVFGAWCGALRPPAPKQTAAPRRRLSEPDSG